MARKTIRIITYGGLGDILLTTPAIAALRKAHPRARICIYGLSREYMDIFRHNPHVDKLSDISFRRNPLPFLLHKYRLAKFHSSHYGRSYPTLSADTPAAQIIAGYFDVTITDPKVQLFLSREEDDSTRKALAGISGPVILHITSATTKNQEWPLSNWEALVASMPGHTFIQLGLPKEEKVNGALDWRGKFSFRECFGLIKYAHGFAGVNSVFSHVTNAFDTPGVVLFGPSQPAIWGQSNNINLYGQLRCSPCVDLLFKTPCPYGKLCMTGITVEQVRDSLLYQLTKRNDHETKDLIRTGYDAVAYDTADGAGQATAAG